MVNRECRFKALSNIVSLLYKVEAQTLIALNHFSKSPSYFNGDFYI